MFKNGEGVPVDYNQALSLFHKAAEKGDKTAQYNIGLMYEEGKGVEKNYELARGWYQKAAENGDKDAQSALERLEQSAGDQ